ncbi:uncharacterized protein J3R85_003821 [Psidium guajava]|nr:uncharacterized protein J3R85_003821 [Psidium guajava]
MNDTGQEVAPNRFLTVDLEVWLGSSNTLLRSLFCLEGSLQDRGPFELHLQWMWRRSSLIGSVFFAKKQI